jgi:hypothetical protein
MSMFSRFKALCLAVPLAGLMFAPAAAQAHVDFMIGLGGFPPPVYYAPPPPPPVYYAPPPVYYAPPVREYYAAPPVYYEPDWRWRHHHHWHHDDD